MMIVADDVYIEMISFLFLYYKQAGCISEAQSWEDMVKSMPEPSKESAWSKAV